MRTVAALLGLISFATLSAEGIAVAILASRGQLNAETLDAIGGILSGEATESEPAAAPASPAVVRSADELDEARLLKTLDLNARADELRLLKDILTAEAAKLEAERTAYDGAKAEFDKRIEAFAAQNADDATEQTRSVVKAMPPRQAVSYLLALPEPDVVRVIRGLPERTTAKILQEFAAGTDEEQQRGRAVFTAISEGLPEAAAANAARDALDGTPAGDATP